jgi:hypothetical protein
VPFRVPSTHTHSIHSYQLRVLSGFLSSLVLRSGGPVLIYIGVVEELLQHAGEHVSFPRNKTIVCDATDLMVDS